MQFNIKLEDVKYLKILCKDINNRPHTFKAALKKIDEKKIYVCSKFEEGPDIIAPQEIVLSFVCDDGLHRTKTMMTYIENDEPYIFMDLEIPERLEYVQNREFFRIPVKYDCIYKVKIKDEEKQFKVKTVDISANGISVLLPELAVSDNDASLDVHIAGINLHVKIKYVRGEKVKEGYRISFTYTEISQMDKDFISKTCIQLQLNQKRKYTS